MEAKNLLQNTKVFGEQEATINTNNEILEKGRFCIKIMSLS